MRGSYFKTTLLWEIPNPHTGPLLQATSTFVSTDR